MLYSSLGGNDLHVLRMIINVDLFKKIYIYKFLLLMILSQSRFHHRIDAKMLLNVCTVVAEPCQPVHRRNKLHFLR